MEKYVSPDFDVTVFEIEDEISFEITSRDPNSGGSNSGEWWG